MKKAYTNTLGSERTVELEYMYSSLEEHCGSHTKILDVGGIPSNPNQMSKVYELIKNKSLNYNISDFRGGQYKGDFIKYDFKKEKFNFIIFLSSLEHFPQCTEGPDLIYRKGEDQKGFAKALDLLEKDGLILLTVPFGVYRWQDYHQNYDLEGILNLTKGSKMIESFVYKLESSTKDYFSGEWVLTDPKLAEDLIYTDRAFGCGCFLFKKNNS